VGSIVSGLKRYMLALKNVNREIADWLSNNGLTALYWFVTGSAQIEVGSQGIGRRL
jgi:hypothetical protein